ncbi:MAG: alpha/beta hydrolase [Anaerolineales bacterium]
MEIETIPLRDDAKNIHLAAYRLHNSAEFQVDRARPAIIICPGGGYQGTSDREAEPIAMRFLAQGYHAFVLRYSVRTRLPAPMRDLARAVALVRKNAKEWFVNPDQIAVCGFSAGGHLAASLGVFWDKPFLTEQIGLTPEQVRPNALILSYAVTDLTVLATAAQVRDVNGQPVFDMGHILAILYGLPNPTQTDRDQYRLDLQVTANTPPTFLWHTAEDEIVPVNNALRFAAALDEHKVPFELHVFERGVHGLALGDEVTEVDGRFINRDSQVWVELALNWLRRHNGGAG